jgi:hypothetical protein
MMTFGSRYQLLKATVSDGHESSKVFADYNKTKNDYFRSDQHK